MASFGESLRREREMRGVSLEEISATTKISLRFLEALEAEDFAKLPGGVFTRGFLRAYAGYLGLDAEHILAEYQLVAPQHVEVDPRASGTRLPQARRGSLARSAPLFVAIPLLMIGYMLYRYSHRTPDIPVSVGVTAPASSPATPVAQNAAAGSSLAGSPSGTTATVAPNATGPASQPNTTPGPVGEGSMGAEKPPSGAQLSQEAAGLSASAVALTGAQSATGNPAGSLSATPASRAAKGPGAESLVLEVAATERAWVAVDADGKTVFQRTLNPNEVKTFTAKDSFEVWTGNAQGTVLTLNGTKQRVLGRAGEIKRIRFTRDNLQQSAP